MFNPLLARLTSSDFIAKIKVLGLARIFGYYNFTIVIVNIFSEPLDLKHIILYLFFIAWGIVWLIIHNKARRKKNYQGWL